MRSSPSPRHAQRSQRHASREDSTQWSYRRTLTVASPRSAVTWHVAVHVAVVAPARAKEGVDAPLPPQERRRLLLSHRLDRNVHHLVQDVEQEVVVQRDPDPSVTDAGKEAISRPTANCQHHQSQRESDKMRRRPRLCLPSLQPDDRNKHVSCWT